MLHKIQHNMRRKYKTHFFITGLIFVLISLTSCFNKSAQVKHYRFPEGTISQFILRNKKGMEVRVINYGATITNIFAPDWAGRFEDVVLGFDSVQNYLSKSNPYFGCVLGRYAGRIANASFLLNGDTVRLTKNLNKKHSFSGGINAFNRQFWDIESYSDSSLNLSYFSKDGEEGFPGNLQVQITYTLSSQNELKIDYLATTDKPTVVNLSNHSYFNLSGGAEPTILNHEVYLNANQITEVDDMLIPTGKILPILGGPLDFSCSCRKIIGMDINQLPTGYDANYILNKSGERLSLAAVVYDPYSGRGMEVSTTQPAVQFYTGNFLNGTLKGKKGIKYGKQAGFCLETQHYPDSPNHPEFPTTILNPGDKYSETTIYKFFTK